MSQNHTKTALITGGSIGLGRAFVDLLILDGWKVVSVDVSKPKKATSFTHINCDLSNRDEVDALPEKLSKHGPFGLVVFNAGISATGKFEEMPAKAYLKLLRINAEAPMVLASQLSQNKFMAENSKITFISSLSHFTGYPGAAVYAASKDAIAVYAKSIKKPFAAKNIGVSCAFPGPLKTEHAKRYSPQGSSDEKRLEPQEAAKLILDGVFAGKSKIYVGSGALLFAFLGRLFPTPMSYIMKKVLFEKLDKNTY